jgi:hypothetical protein
MTVKAGLRAELKRADCTSLMRFLDALFISRRHRPLKPPCAVYQFSSAR